MPLIDPTARSFDPDRTREIVYEARRTGKNPTSAVAKEYGVTRAAARALVEAVDAADRDRPWQADTSPRDDLEGMPLRPGDVLAVGLDNGRCPVGLITAVNDLYIRLNLYSWPLGTFTAGTAVIRHDQVRELSTLAVQDDAGVYLMESLRVFQTAWTEGDR